MMKRVRFRRVLFLWTALLCLGCGAPERAWATHQKAAELIIEYVSGYTYRAKLYTYTFAGSPVNSEREVMEIAWGDGTYSILSRSRMEDAGNQTLLNYYEGVHEYAGPGTYVLFMEDPNRNSGVINVPNSVMTPMFISSTLVISPWLGGNNSPVTTVSPVLDNACLGQMYVHNPGAYDPDGDMLTYRLVPCRGEGGEPVPGYTYPQASDSFYMERYSGNLIWNVPVVQGEYNVAILIEQWRDEMKIGDLTRDMQIIVQACDNLAPFIETDDEVCVEAGKRLYLLITVLDPDQDRITLGFSGELARNAAERAGMQRLYASGDTTVYAFYWDTRYTDARKTPYQLYLRAEDDGTPHLSHTKTVDINVVAPAVNFTRAEAHRGAMELRWNRTPCAHADSYTLYRRSVQADEEVYDSCRTGISDEAYKAIARLQAGDTSYQDREVEQGRRYCYRVVCNFPDGAQSKASGPVCLETYNPAPLITKVSVEKTDLYEGAVQVCWVRPKDMDGTTADGGVYRLYKLDGGDSLIWVADYPLDSAVCHLDSNCNTALVQPYYRVYWDTLPSADVSSVYLTALGLAGRISLRWVCERPWISKQYRVYRRSADSAEFALLATVTEKKYEDFEVEPENQYVYYVEETGSYDSERVPHPLYNKSNMVGEAALPAEPCTPWLFLLERRCDPLTNVLVWDFDSRYNPFAPPSSSGGTLSAEERTECEHAASHYEVYRQKGGEKGFSYLSSVDEKKFTDEDPGSLFCRYRVKTIGRSGAESPMSNILEADNWSCFRFRVPNVFTPNADGINDRWKAVDPPGYIEQFHIRVIDRWGVEVFRSSDILFEWDGTVGGKGSNVCPDGPYFYYAEFKVMMNGALRERIQSGSVTLLR